MKLKLYLTTEMGENILTLHFAALMKGGNMLNKNNKQVIIKN